jgi:hypothetical protein
MFPRHSIAMATTISRFERIGTAISGRGRKRVGDTPPSRWAFDNLWRAAMAEVDAR